MRFSATMLEAYRRWRDLDDRASDELDRKMLEELEALIRGELEATPAMLRGWAVHEVLAFPERYAFTTAEGEDCYRYEGALYAARPFDAVRQSMGIRVAEVAAELEILGGRHVISCRADGLDGRRVVEIKCPEKPKLDPEKYVRSYQWRIYLAAFDADQVDYHLVVTDEPRRRSGFVMIRDHHAFSMYRYPELEADVRRLAEEFVGFVYARNMESYLIAREEAVR